MQIFINDKAVECAPGTTLPEVLESQGICTDNIAVAVDFEVIPAPTGVKPCHGTGARLLL